MTEQSTREEGSNCFRNFESIWNCGWGQCNIQSENCLDGNWWRQTDNEQCHMIKWLIQTVERPWLVHKQLHIEPSKNNGNYGQDCPIISSVLISACRSSAYYIMSACYVLEHVDSNHLQ